MGSQIVSSEINALIEKGRAAMESLTSQHEAQPQAVRIGQILIDQVNKEAERKVEKAIGETKEAEFAKKSAQIQGYIGKQLATRDDVSKQAQEKLAAATRLIGDIATTDKPWIRNDLSLLSSIDTATKALLRDPSHIEYATRTLKHVRRKVHPIIGAGLWESLKRSMKTSPAAVVVVGLIITFVLLTIVPLLGRGLDLSSVTIGALLNINPSVLLLIGIVGALGSIASIMLRIRDRDFAAYTASSDPWPWLFFGLFKPVIGALFALFIFAVIKSGLLPVEVTDDTEGWLIIAVSFIAGFSERFAPNMLSSTEQVIGGGRPSSHPPVDLVTATEGMENGRKQEATEPNEAEGEQGSG
jgi:hypothetical protein